MPNEKRRSSRTALATKVQVTYVDDQGQERFEIVQTRDISATGCRLLLQHRCPARTVVALAFSLTHTGSASVRFQNPSPRGYITGLEFLGGMQLPIPPNP